MTKTKIKQIGKFYRNNTMEQTMRRFHLTRNTLHKIIQENGFCKHSAKKYGVGTVLDNLVNISD